MIRAAFFGTPAEAVPALAALAGIAEVELVVTRRDRPRGRSKRPVAPPVKDAAARLGLEVAQPGPLAELIPRLERVDVAVLVAYGRLVPGEVLDAPRRGFVNVHFSLLPRWRGASPVVRAILAGDAVTGVSLMAMDAGFDTGAIISARSIAVDPDETTGELTGRLADLGAGLIGELLPEWVAGRLDASPQDEASATAAAKVSVAEAFLAPHLHGGGEVLRAVRAFNPRPGAWGVIEGSRLKVWRAAGTGHPPIEPGVAIGEGGRVLLGCADGVVDLLEVQPEGRPVMSATSWMNGRRHAVARFEAPAA